MSETITFTAPLPPLRLRRNRETQKPGYRSALIREYQEQVWCAGHEYTFVHPSSGSLADFDFKRQPWPRAHLTLTWRHHRVGPDHDNALASCKWLIDVLKATGPRPLGIIVDDAPANLTVELKTEKVRRKEDEGVLVEIERTEPTT